MSLWQATGLVLDGVGALLVLLPEFDSVSRWSSTSEEVDKLETGRETFLTKGNLTPEDEGFNEVIEALKGNIPIHGQPKSLVITDSWGERDAAELRYETDGDAIHAVKDPVSPSLVDRYIERQINHLERRTDEMFLRVGVGFLLVAFALQLLGTI